MTHNTLFPFPQQGDPTLPPSTNALHPIKSLLELQQKEHFQKQTEVLMLLLPHGNAGLCDDFHKRNKLSFKICCPLQAEGTTRRKRRLTTALHNSLIEIGFAVARTVN